jgi:hypothetical protein
MGMGLRVLRLWVQLGPLLHHHILLVELCHLLLWIDDLSHLGRLLEGLHLFLVGLDLGLLLLRHLVVMLEIVIVHLVWRHHVVRELTVLELHLQLH